jgi:hypothetical protein
VPYAKEKTGDTYRVVNTETKDVKGSGMTEEHADSQLRLLNAIEHGYTPTRRHPAAKLQSRFPLHLEPVRAVRLLLTPVSPRILEQDLGTVPVAHHVGLQANRAVRREHPLMPVERGHRPERLMTAGAVTGAFPAELACAHTRMLPVAKSQQVSSGEDRDRI